MKENSAQKIAQKIFQAANTGNKKVLEIGCGNGRITALIASKPKALVAIDPDNNEINTARRRVPGVDFQVGSGEKLIFPNESFDLVVFTLSLHHQDSDLAIREAVRVLKPGGEIVVVEPRIEGELERVFALVSNENKAKLNAQNAIRKSNLKILNSEVFSGEWIFNGKDDLCHSLFKFYGLPFDPKIQEEIIEMIGEKADSDSIVLQDLMEIKVLKKP